MAPLKPVRVTVRAPDTVARKMIYALEELLTAAGVPHRVGRAETSADSDLYYADSPPDGDALWMAASPVAWRFFEKPGIRVECVDTQRVSEQWIRLPGWGNRGAGLPESAALPDLAAAAFFFLARWEEWRSRERDRFGRFPLATSVFGRGLWSLTECPVESYAGALRRALETAPRTTWLSGSAVSPPWSIAGDDRAAASRPAFAVGLSHDIDTVRRWDARGFARTGREAARALLRGHFAHAARASRELVAGLGARADGRDPHSNLEEIVRLECAAAARSTFFLLARHAHPWDGTHAAHYQGLLPSMAGTLARVAEVGVHASTTATGLSALQEERERIRQLTRAPVRGVRFHNLRGGYGALPMVEAAGLEYDSTVGFAEEPGFPAGAARPFRPYDRERDRPLDLVEVPLAVMDTTLLSPRYLGLEVRAGRQRALLALESVRRWGGAAALLWHNDNLPPNDAAGYAALYSELLQWVGAAGGRVSPLAEIVDDWKQARATLADERGEP